MDENGGGKGRKGSQAGEDDEDCEGVVFQNVDMIQQQKVTFEDFTDEEVRGE